MVRCLRPHLDKSPSFPSNKLSVNYASHACTYPGPPSASPSRHLSQPVHLLSWNDGMLPTLFHDFFVFSWPVSPPLHTSNTFWDDGNLQAFPGSMIPQTINRPPPRLLTCLYITILLPGILSKDNSIVEFYVLPRRPTTCFCRN